MFGIDDAVTAGSNLLTTAINKIWPDTTEIEKVKFSQLSNEFNGQLSLILSQIDVNKEEAKNPHWFVAGARPAALWVCVSSLFYSGIGISLGSWIALCFGLPPLPLIDSTIQTNLLYALLGVGGLRTVEKLKGAQTNRLSNG